jgi:hypothetical protein
VIRILPLIFIMIFCSGALYAHDIQLITQHLDIKKQNKVGWQQDIIARATFSRKLDAGLQATYLSRFNISDKRVGAFIGFSPIDRLFVEVKYLQGMGNTILPEKSTQLTSYYTIASGLSAFGVLKNNRYARLNLNSVNLGIEIEKIPSFIIIPQVMIGNAIFKDPAQTKSIHSFGLKGVFYREKNFSVFVFGAKGREPAQVITGVSNIMVSTVSTGAGGGYYFKSNFRGELIFDHTDYQQIHNQFFTTTLLLNYYF